MAIVCTGVIVPLYFWLIAVPTVQSDCNQDYQSYLQGFVKNQSKIAGASYLQNLLNLEKFKPSQTNITDAMVDVMLTSLKNNLTAVFDRLQDVRSIFEMLITDTSVSAIQECCKVYSNTTAYDIYYQTQVADTLCYRAADATVPLPLISKDKIHNATEKMKAIKASSNLIKWMYMGLESGLFITYPARQANSCSSYDPTVRPWYVEASSRNAKNVIILIDISKSLGEDGLNITKQAAATVLATLSPRDKVVVVTFTQSIANIQLECGLAYATPEVTTNLTSYVNSLTLTQYASDFTVGLRETQHYLTPFHPSQSNTVIFLTRGNNFGNSIDAKNLVANITSKNAKVLVYGVLPDPSKEPFLKSLAEAGNGTANFIRLDYTSNIRFLMGTYYRSLNPRDVSTGDTPTVSVPYIDFSGLGNVFTVCLPIFSNTSNFLGAACIDVTILDISLLLTFPNYDTSYGFLVDARDGRSIYHPLLPPPGPTGNSQANPLFVNITDLEKDCPELIRKILETNRSDDSINKLNCTTKMFAITLGRTTADGVTTKNTTAIFNWQVVSSVGGLIAVLIVAQDEFLKQYSINIDPTNFTFHSVQTQQCYHMGSASTDFSSLALSPDTLISRYSPVFSLEHNPPDQQILSNVNQYFQENQGRLAHGYFQPDIRTLVVLTNLMQSHWNSVLHPLRHFLVGFSQGVLRTFPGVFIKQQPFPNFIQDSWFARALAQPSKVIFTGPQQGLGNQADPVITISKAITHSSNDAVIGMEVTIGYLITELNKVLPNGLNCTNCLLLDEAGFVIFHPSFIQNCSYKTAPTKPIHIGDMEPGIAATVLNLCNMQSCQDFAWKKSYSTWGCSPNNTCLNDQGIQASHIDGSNLVLVVSSSPLQGHLTYPYWDIHQCRSTRLPNTPCYNNIIYNFCQNTFSSAGTGIRCNDNTETLVSSDIVPSTVPQLPGTCMRTVCQQLPTVNDCNLYSNYSCYWCNGQCITTQCPVDCVVGLWSDWSKCSVSCGEGQETRTRAIKTLPQNNGTTCPNLNDITHCSQLACPGHINPAAIIAPVVGGSLIIILIILAILYRKGKLCFCPRVRYQEDESPYHDIFLTCDPPGQISSDYLHFPPGNKNNTYQTDQLSSQFSLAQGPSECQFNQFNAAITAASDVMFDADHVHYTTIMTDLQAREVQGVHYESSSDPNPTEDLQQIQKDFSAPEQTPLPSPPYPHTNLEMNDTINHMGSCYLTTMPASQFKPPPSVDQCQMPVSGSASAQPDKVVENSVFASEDDVVEQDEQGLNSQFKTYLDIH